MPESVADQAAVQRCTEAYTTSQPEPRDVIIAFRIRRSLVERIESYRSLHHKMSRTDAVMDLLEHHPIVVKYFQVNLYNVQLVDDITQGPQDRIEAVIGALSSKRERRFRLKIGRHYHE